MRIIGGTRRGHKLTAPKGMTTRPTQDRVREAIFNTLANVGLLETRVLDLYAGTGAMALEALSRGAEFACAVDEKTAAVIRQNAEVCDFSSQIEVRDQRVESALANLPQNQPFDYVFLDPPYQRNLVESALQKLLRARLVQPTSVVVIEQAREENLEIPKGYRFWRQKHYGGTMVTYLVVEEEEG